MTNWTSLIGLMTWLLLTSPIAAEGLANGPTAEPDALPAMLQLAVARDRAGDVGTEYHIDAEGRGTNPRHGLVLAFTSRGVQVDGHDGGFALQLTRFGRGNGLPVRHTKPRISRAWVEYDRSAGLKEWFVNLPQGVEQGWTVADRPAGSGPLMLELDTGRPPDLAEPEQLLWSGIVYHGLVALDAEGRHLPAQWMHRGRRLRIEVDDNGAVYPILIDPWMRGSKLTAADAMDGDAFGSSTALSDDGDTALVGAQAVEADGNTDQGAAYIFERDGDVWVESARLLASDGAAGDTFGSWVALAGDTALVAALGADVDGNMDQGAAYIFNRSGDIWTEQAKLTASDGTAGDGFGGAVVALSSDGSMALIAALGVDVDGSVDQGAVYVFTRNGEVWSEQTKLTASDGVGGDRFGSAIAFEDDTAVIGANGATVNGNIAQGAAYVFTHSEGIWTEQAKLTASDGAANHNFGTLGSALSGDTAVVGAPLANNNRGAAYVFSRSGELWTEEAKLTPPGFSQVFGISIGLSDDTAVIGAAFPVCIGCGFLSGTAYVFAHSEGVWSQQTQLAPHPADQGNLDDGFGSSVSLSAAGVAIVGSWGAKNAGVATGAVYEFLALPPNFAILHGTVRSLGSACALDSSPIEGATVHVLGAEGEYSVESDPNGYYAVAVDEADSPVGIEVTASNHLSTMIDDVEVIGDDTLRLDIDLQMDVACIEVNPTELSIQLPQGQAAVEPLTVVNPGHQPLVWQVTEESATNRRRTLDVARRATQLRTVRRSGFPSQTHESPVLMGHARPSGHRPERFGDTRVPDAVAVSTSPHGGDEITISQSASLEIEVQNTVACNTKEDGTTTPNQFLRAFTLSDFGITEAFHVSEVTFGVETLRDTTAVIGVNLYMLQGGAFIYDNLTPIGSTTLELQPQEQTLVTVPVSGTALAGSTLVVEIAAPDLVGLGVFFPGSNGLGETAPSYHASDHCAQSEPTPYGDLGFPGVHLVTTVTGTSEPLHCTLPAWASVDPPSGSISGGSEQVVDVTFDATGLEPGEFEANLCLGSNDLNRPVTVVSLALTVTGAGNAELTFDPPNLDFGDVEVGETTTPQTATLRNTGDVDATSIDFTLPSGDFDADTSACSDTLPPDASCPVSVTLTPVEPGPTTTILQASSAEGASADLSLSGTGVGDGGFTPMAIEVDPEPFLADGNSVFEPGELVEVAPNWRNDGPDPEPLTGTAANFNGADGAIYFLALEDADYGNIEPGVTAGCRDTGVCYFLAVNDPTARPAAHWEAAFDETLSDDTTKTWSLHIGDSFMDVPRSSPFYPAVETLLHNRVTGGCTATEYCPAGGNSRGQMAVFLLKAAEDGNYVPPGCAEGEEPFADVPFDSPFCPWIQELANRGVVAGCGGGDYCPGDPVTRAQMAIFLLKTIEDDGYEPPTCTGVFDDVDCPSLFADWIEDLAARGITGGCSQSEYCPGNPVSRAQMAVFVTKAFELTLYGP